MYISVFVSASHWVCEGLTVCINIAVSSVLLLPFSAHYSCQCGFSSLLPLNVLPSDCELFAM